MTHDELQFLVLRAQSIAPRLCSVGVHGTAEVTPGDVRVLLDRLAEYLRVRRMQTEKPNQADGDLRGDILGWNNETQSWIVIHWMAAIRNLKYTHWTKMPPAMRLEASRDV